MGLLRAKAGAFYPNPARELAGDRVNAPAGAAWSACIVPCLGFAQKRRQLGERADDRVRLRTVPLERCAGAAYPDRREAEGLGADRIPAVGRDKADARRWQLQIIDGELINAWARLVDARSVDRQDGVEVRREPTRSGEQPDPLARRVGQDR